MNSIKDLIIQIEKRPAMYIGKNYISCLKAFIDGWYLRDKKGIRDEILMEDFQLWISSKYKVASNQSWADIILFYSQDEADALENFFSEFNSFLEEKSH